MRYCGHFLIKAEGGAKNYERDHPLPLSWQPFTVVFVQRKGYRTAILGLSPLDLGSITLSLPKRCNITPRNVHERFQTLLTPVLTLFTDFLSAVVTSEIAQILSLYGGGFLALKWQS